MKAVWLGVLALVVAGGAAAAEPKKIQCWTDKNGQRMCGDRVPPEYAGERRDIMKGGRVIGTLSATKTPEEIAAEKREKDRQEAQEKQLAYDRALLESYRNTNDIVAMRDERLALIDSRIQSAEKNRDDIEKTLVSLKGRAAQQAQNGKPPDEKLNKQIAQFEKSQQQNHAALQRYQTERESVQAKFDKDLARYTELRGAAPPEKKSAQAATPATPATPANPKAGTPAKPATPAQPAKK